MRRIPDWSALDATARRRRREIARPLATALDPFLNAFAQIDTSSRSLTPAGRLGGVPYAAKDLFQTSSQPAGRRVPRSDRSRHCRNQRSPRTPRCSRRRSHRLHQHDRTGLRAVRLQRDARARQKSVEPGLHLRRLVVGLGGRCRERRRCRRAGFRHRRLGAHSRPCLRHHGLEADPWCSVGAGHDAACSHARHHRPPGPQRVGHDGAGRGHGRAAVVAAHAPRRRARGCGGRMRSGHPARARGRRGSARRDRRRDRKSPGTGRSRGDRSPCDDRDASRERAGASRAHRRCGRGAGIATAAGQGAGDRGCRAGRKRRRPAAPGARLRGAGARRK